MNEPLRVLIVEDSEDDALLLLRALRQGGYAPEHRRVETAAALDEALAAQAWDVVLSDYRLPQFDGLAALAAARRHDAELPFIVVSGAIGEDLAVAAMKAGAHDYVLKDRLARLAPAVRRERAEAEVRRRNRRGEEERERLLAELTRSNEELEQFAYVASHDLQEPLRAVTGYLSLIEESLRDQLDETTRRRIQGAVEGATRMNALIADLLALSRVGSRGAAFAPVALNEPLAEALVRLETGVRETGAVVTYDALPTVPADGGQMVQLFQNLIGNAIKFRREGVAPQVHIGAERMPDRSDTSAPSAPGPRPSNPPSPGGWILTVRDNGIGIEPQYFERIFLIFQRLHTRRQYPGTGIGLAICKKIVERHGGRIWVESQPGVGSGFRFSLPAAGAD